jgi:HEPN domain-containing protein
MKAYFSKRHADAFKSGKFPLGFSRRLRHSILRILERFSDSGGWNNEDNHTFDAATEALLTFYGIPSLQAFSGSDSSKERVNTNFAGLLQRGYPSEVLDAIEAWFDQQPRSARECEGELNDCFSMHGSSWRFVNGEAILVSSEYLHEEVQARTLRLLGEGGAFGALEEFQSAIQDLQAGETKDAVIKAHKSLESVMKTALRTNEHKTFGRLLSDLIDSGLIPEYYDEFLRHFEKVALGAVKERNRPGTGHGQGSEPVEVSRSLAEFTINLVATVNLFIIQRWIEMQSSEQSAEPEADDIPF